MKYLPLFFLCILSFRVIASESTYHYHAEANIQPIDEQSHVYGKVTFDEVPGGLRVQARIHNAPPGDHGFHIHDYGDLSNEGKAAGDHYNPENSKHGYIVKGDYTKAHAGDFGNIYVDKNGDGDLNLFIPGLSIMGGKYNINGRSVILHASKDDFSQPSGNAGARIGGGVIHLTSPGEK